MSNNTFLYGGKLSSVSLNVPFINIEAVFHLPSRKAAAALGMCPSSLKKVCRKYGLVRWPYRRLKGSSGKMENSQAPTSNAIASSTKENSQASDAIASSTKENSQASDAIASSTSGSAHALAASQRSPQPVTSDRHQQPAVSDHSAVQPFFSAGHERHAQPTSTVATDSTPQPFASDGHASSEPSAFPIASDSSPTRPSFTHLLASEFEDQRLLGPLPSQWKYLTHAFVSSTVACVCGFRSAPHWLTDCQPGLYAHSSSL